MEMLLMLLLLTPSTHRLLCLRGELLFRLKLATVNVCVFRFPNKVWLPNKPWLWSWCKFVVLVVLVALLVIKDSVFLRINQNIFNDCVNRCALLLVRVLLFLFIASHTTLWWCVFPFLPFQVSMYVHYHCLPFSLITLNGCVHHLHHHQCIICTAVLLHCSCKSCCKHHHHHH